MKQSFDRAGDLARIGFFSLVPAAAAGGALALPVLLTITGAASARPSILQRTVSKPPAGVVALWLLVAWAGLSAAWSPAEAASQALKLVVLAPLGLMFAAASRDPQSARLTLAGALAAFIVLALLLTVEAAFGMPLNRLAQPETDQFEVGRNLNRGAIVLLAIGWPAAAFLMSGWPGRSGSLTAVAILTTSAALSLPFGQEAHVVAIGLGLVAFTLAFAAPRLAVLLASGGMAAWIIIAPFATPLVISRLAIASHLPDSWAVRAAIWRYVCARIPESPWLGHGLDASRVVTDRMTVRGLDLRSVPLHPHSASLQLWYETGLIGAVLAAGALALGGWAISWAVAFNRPAAAAAAASFASLGVIANLSYGAWQEWWIATMFVAAALVGALAPRRPEHRPPQERYAD